jgi:hypothetical protein
LVNLLLVFTADITPAENGLRPDGPGMSGGIAGIADSGWCKY